MTIDVNEFVQDCLEGAREVIEAGDRWTPIVFLVLPDRIQGLVIEKMGSAESEKQRVAELINKTMRQHNATLAVMITDAWMVKAPEGAVLSRPVRDCPNRTEALLVTVWGPNQGTITGLQPYSRDSDGKPVFEEFSWHPPGTRSLSRFAGDDMGKDLEENPTPPAKRS